MTKSKEPVYRARILELIALGKVPSEPGLHHLDIYHDDWCAIWQGGACDCDPVLKMREDREPTEGSS